MKKRMLGIFVFLLIGILALGATGCSALLGTTETGDGATATPAPDATTPPQQVVDAEYVLYDAEADFSIQYHGSWVIKENKSEDGTTDIDYSEVTFTIPEGATQDVDNTGAQVYPTLSVYQFAMEDAANFDLKSYAESQVKNLESNVYQFTLLKEMVATEINGVAAYSIEYSGSVLNANDLRVKQVFLADEAFVYVLSYGANADFYTNENYVSIADKMLASFTLK